VISGYLIAENYKPDGRWLNQADADVALCQGAPWTKIILKIHIGRATSAQATVIHLRPDEDQRP
jgi:hypothetical protein